MCSSDLYRPTFMRNIQLVGPLESILLWMPLRSCHWILHSNNHGPYQFPLHNLMHINYLQAKLTSLSSVTCAYLDTLHGGNIETTISVLCYGQYVEEFLQLLALVISSN